MIQGQACGKIADIPYTIKHNISVLHLRYPIAIISAGVRRVRTWPDQLNGKRDRGWINPKMCESRYAPIEGEVVVVIWRPVHMLECCVARDRIGHSAGAVVTLYWSILADRSVNFMCPVESAIWKNAVDLGPVVVCGVVLVVVVVNHVASSIPETAILPSKLDEYGP